MGQAEARGHWGDGAVEGRRRAVRARGDWRACGGDEGRCVGRRRRVRWAKVRGWASGAVSWGGARRPGLAGQAGGQGPASAGNRVGEGKRKKKKRRRKKFDRVKFKFSQNFTKEFENLQI